MTTSRLLLADLNGMDEQAFVDAIGFVFEHSPWIAEKVWSERPFFSIPALHAAMCSVVQDASIEQRLRLLRQHPDLAGRAAIAGELTAESTREQTSAGLGQLTASEYAAFTERNEAYKSRFGMPFIICVREHTKTSILVAFDERLKNDFIDEISTAIGEVVEISRLRLNDALTE